MSSEPEFVDHYPGEEEEEDEESSSSASNDAGELLFAESAGEALSSSSSQRRAPPPRPGGRRPSGRLRRPGPPRRGGPHGSSSGHHRAGSRSGPRPAGSRSGPHRAASGKHRAGGRSGAHPLPPPQAPPPDPSADAALSLLAQVKPAPEGDPYVNRELGPFKVEGFLALDRGERRYVAQHTESKDYVLLRVYPLKGSYSGEFSKLATRGERACRVQHPQLASALGAGKAGDCFFVGAPPPLGKRLSTILAEGEPLDPKALETLLADVGAALGALHQRQLVHANVSPDTIRLHEGRWYLHEAGLSRPRSEFDFLSAGGEVLGDPGFIAPETVDSGEQTSASDLYALGCVAWTALSLEPPFKGDDPVQVLLDQLNVDVPPVKGVEGKPPAPEPLLTIVGKLCGYTPSVRYSASRELLTDLKGLERGDVPSPFGQDLRQDEQDRAPEKLSSSRTLVIVLAALNVMALVALGFFAWQYSQIEYKDPLDAFSLPDLTQAPAAPSGE